MHGRIELDAQDTVVDDARREAGVADDPQRTVASRGEPVQAAFGAGVEQSPRRAVIARHRELTVFAADPHRIATRDHVAQAELARGLAALEVARVR